MKMKLARILSLTVTISLALAIAILYPLEMISDKVFKGIVSGLAASFILSEALEWKEYRSEVKKTLEERLDSYKSELEKKLDSYKSELEKKLDSYKSEFILEIRRISDSAEAKDTLKFRDSQETYEYLTKKLEEAKESIIDVTLGPKIHAQLQNIPEYRKKFVEVKKIILAKNKINYKHIAVVNEIGRLTRIQEEFEKSKNYFVGIIDSKDNIPKLSFYIIDKKEVIIGGLKMYDKTTTSQEITISNPVVVKLFIEYFNLIWKSDYCETIEDEKSKKEVIAKLKNQLK